MTTFPPSVSPVPAVRPQAVLARNWLKTLWPASYKGVPFKVEWDEEEGRRRIVEHEFPMRDDPFLEDLGEGVRHYRVDAYVASDGADSEAAAVIAVCAMRGPGALVLPAHGPIITRCLTFRRNRQKDKHGYIALELRFAREGFASALASIASLANLVFVQAESAATAVANAFVSAVQFAQQADYVVSVTADRVQDAISTLEVVRTTQPVDPAAGSTQRAAIQTLFDQTPNLIADPGTIAQVPQGVVAIARALGDAMPAASAAAAFAAIVTDPSFSAIVSNVYPTPSRRTAESNANAAYQLLRLAAVTAYCEAVARMTFADRQSAITTRANVVEFFEQETNDLPSEDIDLVHAIEQLRDTVVNYLSRAIIDLAPVVTVEANLSMPSLFWAWRLYADPLRSTDLVERNRLPHPSFFPFTFEALAK